MMVVKTKKAEVLTFQDVKNKAFGKENQPACAR